MKAPIGDRLLALALGAAHWLNNTKLCTSSGDECHWAMNSTDAAPHNHPELAQSLYYGSLGPAIFFLQLANATAFAQGAAAPEWRELANKAAASAAKYDATGAYKDNIGFYYGIGGIAYGLRAAGGTAEFSAASALEAHMLSVAPLSASPGARLWNNTDVAHGISGAGLYLLWLSARAEVDKPARRAALAAAVRGGKWLLGRAEPTSPGGAGLRWARGPDTDGQHANQYFPTFCCGTAGVAYYLLALREALPLVEHGKEEEKEAEVMVAPPHLRRELLAAAVAGAEHILSMANRSTTTTTSSTSSTTTSSSSSSSSSSSPSADELLIPHADDGEGRSIYYLGWCGGPPGWARLFVILHRATGEQRWLDALADATNALIQRVTQLAMYLPLPPHTPPWANLGQCCGVASAGTFLLALAASSNASVPLEPSLKAQAQATAMELAEAIAQRAVPTEAAAGTSSMPLAFPSPEEHAAPLDTRWQAGWMQGAAGIASFLLDARAAALGTHDGARQRWPDEPWAE